MKISIAFVLSAISLIGCGKPSGVAMRPDYVLSFRCEQETYGQLELATGQLLEDLRFDVVMYGKLKSERNERNYSSTDVFGISSDRSAKVELSRNPFEIGHFTIALWTRPPTERREKLETQLHLFLTNFASESEMSCSNLKVYSSSNRINALPIWNASLKRNLTLIEN